MLFSEVDLYIACCEVYKIFQNTNDEPGADWRLIQYPARSLLFCKIVRKLPKNHVDVEMNVVIDMYQSIRKAGQDRFDVYELIVENGIEPKCCYAELGGCCDQITIDRLVPGKSGGQYEKENTRFACRRHNSAKGSKSVYEFIRLHAKGITAEKQAEKILESFKIPLEK